MASHHVTANSPPSICKSQKEEEEEEKKKVLDFCSANFVLKEETQKPNQGWPTAQPRRSSNETLPLFLEACKKAAQDSPTLTAGKHHAWPGPGSGVALSIKEKANTALDLGHGFGNLASRLVEVLG